MPQIDFPVGLHDTVTLLGAGIRGEVRALSVDTDGIKQVFVRYVISGQPPKADWYDARDVQLFAPVVAPNVPDAAPGAAVRSEDATVSLDRAAGDAE